MTTLTQRTPPPYADVVIVGAGCAGLSAAAPLAASGASVCVVEAAGHLGAGTAAAGPGHAMLAVAEPHGRLAASLGASGLRNLLSLTRDALATVPARRWRARGLLWAAAEPDREPLDLARSADVLRALGVSAAPMDSAPLSAHARSTHLGPALRVADAGAVDVPGLLDDLASRARAAGARIVGSARVLGIDDRPDGVTLTLDEGRTLRAEVVILACGVDAARLDPRLADVLVSVREAAIAAPAPGPDLAIRAGFGWTAITRHAGRVVLSGCRWASPTLETDETDPCVVHPAVAERLRASLVRFLPDAGAPGAPWAWIEAHGCDGLPVVGPVPGTSRIIVCAGFAANPVGFGLACGAQVARGLIDGVAPALPASLSSQRFLP